MAFLSIFWHAALVSAGAPPAFRGVTLAVHEGKSSPSATFPALSGVENTTSGPSHAAEASSMPQPHAGQLMKEIELVLEKAGYDRNEVYQTYKSRVLADVVWRELMNIDSMSEEVRDEIRRALRQESGLKNVVSLLLKQLPSDRVDWGSDWEQRAVQILEMEGLELRLRAILPPITLNNMTAEIMRSVDPQTVRDMSEEQRREFRKHLHDPNFDKKMAAKLLLCEDAVNHLHEIEALLEAQGFRTSLGMARAVADLLSLDTCDFSFGLTCDNLDAQMMTLIRDALTGENGYKNLVNGYENLVAEVAQYHGVTNHSRDIEDLLRPTNFKSHLDILFQALAAEAMAKRVAAMTDLSVLWMMPCEMRQAELDTMNQEGGYKKLIEKYLLGVDHIEYFHHVVKSIEATGVVAKYKRNLQESLSQNCGFGEL